MFIHLVVKLLCSEIQTWESCIFRFSKETSQSSAANRLKIHIEEFQITAAELDSILGIGASINICTKHLLVNHDIVDSVSNVSEYLLFMNPETILGILSHNPVTNGSPFIQTSALVCLLESFYGPLSHLLWPDISENSNENYYCELLSTKCPAICSIINKNQLRELLLAYIHDKDLYDSITKTYLGSICLKVSKGNLIILILWKFKVASPDFEVLGFRERLCLEVMIASDNLQPTLSISNRFNLFYKEIFCL
ncbi:unnamed protein product [Schistosoma margrebowiei]|uniref:Uncharacterized protein n=1 Tax=Schistosoma margrebowiei TaxID=48269 RepID=A0A3P8C7I3_9TREM|nr:unnamed protein product [Schistosoma margrebowiei]